MALNNFTITNITGDDYVVSFNYNNNQTSVQTIHIPGQPDLPTISKTIKQFYRAWRQGVRAAATTDPTVIAALNQAQTVAANDPDAS